MGRQIIKQPDGLYCVYSSVVDDFVLINCTKTDLLAYEVYRAVKEIATGLDKTLEVLDNGGKPYLQFTKDFAEAVETVKRIHGKDAETLKMFDFPLQRQKKRNKANG